MVGSLGSCTRLANAADGASPLLSTLEASGVLIEGLVDKQSFRSSQEQETESNYRRNRTRAHQTHPRFSFAGVSQQFPFTMSFGARPLARNLLSRTALRPTASPSTSPLVQLHPSLTSSFSVMSSRNRTSQLDSQSRGCMGL